MAYQSEPRRSPALVVMAAHQVVAERPLDKVRTLASARPARMQPLWGDEAMRASHAVLGCKNGCGLTMNNDSGPIRLPAWVLTTHGCAESNPHQNTALPCCPPYVALTPQRPKRSVNMIVLDVPSPNCAGIRFLPCQLVRLPAASISPNAWALVA